MNIETVRFFVAEIILMIEYLHTNGIGHRDLNPGNIMITLDMHLKLIDFGDLIKY